MCRETIEERLCGVDVFYRNSGLCRELRSLLKPIRDVERSLQRIQLHRGSPRDLGAIATGIVQTAQICARLDDHETTGVWRQRVSDISKPMDLADTLQRALEDCPPLTLDEGHFIRDG
jgi:DNA mismatch repair protein MutS